MEADDEAKEVSAPAVQNVEDTVRFEAQLEAPDDAEVEFGAGAEVAVGVGAGRDSA